MTKTKQRVVRQGRTEAEKAVSRGRNLLIKAGHEDYWKHVLANGAPQIDTAAMRRADYCVLGRTFAENIALDTGFDYGIRELSAFAPSTHLRKPNWSDDPLTIDPIYYGFSIRISERLSMWTDWSDLADAWVAQAFRDKARAGGHRQ